MQKLCSFCADSFAFKGWKCCKSRVLTFDEFLSIPPCTIGKHSTVDDTPQPPPTEKKDILAPRPVARAVDVNAPIPTPPRRLPTTQQEAKSAASAAPPESDSDDPATPVPPSTSCKRRGCGFQSPEDSSKISRDNEKCIYHPGQALFHEGSKGWTCCKKRVLEFDEFMKIQGCKERPRHCFVGKKGLKRKPGGLGDDYEKVENIRHDFYQTSVQVHASLYLKKIDKEKSRVEFTESGSTIQLDLKTSDAKQYRTEIPLYGKIEPSKSSFVIKGTKLDLTLVKADGQGWPVLRADEDSMGQIIQSGQAGVAAKS